MASACVNNIGMSPENFLDCPATFPSYGWLSPRISFSREFIDEESSKTAGAKPQSPAEKPPTDLPPTSDPEVSGKEVGDFEFRLEDPVMMLPADELFSDGKLVPLQLSAIRQSATSFSSSEIRSPETPKSRRRNEVSAMDPYLFSPKAPRCSRRWKDLLGLKKLCQNNNAKQDCIKTTSSLSSHNSNNPKSLKHFLHRSSKSSNLASDSSLSLPLLKDSDGESVSISSRISLSSSSSGHDHDHDHDELHRLSLESEKHNTNPNVICLAKNPIPNPNPPRVRVMKPRAVSSDNPTATRAGQSPMRRAAESTTGTVRGASVDSPRMNSSGKIVFQGLERSSSSPSSFNGGPRFKHRGMERSYSANVRVTPVLNVPVCSLRGSSKSGMFGFPLFSSPQKREGGSGGSNGGGNKSQHSNSRSRSERT